MVLKGLPRQLMLCWKPNSVEHFRSTHYTVHFNRALPDCSDSTIMKALETLVADNYLFPAKYMIKGKYECFYGATEKQGCIPGWRLTAKGHRWVKGSKCTHPWERRKRVA